MTDIWRFLYLRVLVKGWGIRAIVRLYQIYRMTCVFQFYIIVLPIMRKAYIGKFYLYCKNKYMIYIKYLKFTLTYD